MYVVPAHSTAISICCTRGDVIMRRKSGRRGLQTSSTRRSHANAMPVAVNATAAGHHPTARHRHPAAAAKVTTPKATNPTRPTASANTAKLPRFQPQAPAIIAIKPRTGILDAAKDRGSSMLMDDTEPACAESFRNSFRAFRVITAPGPLVPSLLKLAGQAGSPTHTLLFQRDLLWHGAYALCRETHPDGCPKGL